MQSWSGRRGHGPSGRVRRARLSDAAAVEQQVLEHGKVGLDLCPSARGPRHRALSTADPGMWLPPGLLVALNVWRAWMLDSDVETDDCFDFSERPMEYASRDQVVTPVTGEAECIKLQQNGPMALQPRRRRLATQ
ncbi:hypothetical protein OCS_02926 [Ophiocordyceps sinensis CO18]|uniref:Uncharacterized protein n=1 Tax=Ophiocordyceps sinensis (strain Co18 / CGMCC 3.14243) TaxID=911162 RepID=T5AHX2_OPHSC|nr:hypothetical protein OCS_02926 [Ophiocordyceps sinensis CO18]